MNSNTEATGSKICTFEEEKLEKKSNWRQKSIPSFTRVSAMVLALNFFSVEAEAHPAALADIMSSQSSKCHTITRVSPVPATKKPDDSTEYYQSKDSPFNSD